jgi:hypothetical protein
MMRPLLLASVLLSLALSPSATFAAKPRPVPERQLARSRVVLADLVPDAPAELAAVDLGASPAPGSSRLITEEEIVAALPEGTEARTLRLPASIRVVRKARKLAPTELEKITRAAVGEAGLPRSGSLTAARPRATVTVPDGWQRVRVDVPKPPRKSGKHATIATLVFLEGDAVLARVPVPIEITLPKSAAVPDVKKGAKLTFLVSRGSIEIKANVTAAADADVGEELPVVLENKNVLKVRLASKEPPTAVEAP